MFEELSPQDIEKRRSRGIYSFDDMEQDRIKNLENRPVPKKRYTPVLLGDKDPFEEYGIDVIVADDGFNKHVRPGKNGWDYSFLKLHKPISETLPEDAKKGYVNGTLTQAIHAIEAEGHKDDGSIYERSVLDIAQRIASRARDILEQEGALHLSKRYAGKAEMLNALILATMKHEQTMPLHAYEHESQPAAMYH